MQDEMLYYLFDVLYNIYIICNYFLFFMEGHMVEKPLG